MEGPQDLVVRAGLPENSDSSIAKKLFLSSLCQGFVYLFLYLFFNMDFILLYLLFLYLLLDRCTLSMFCEKGAAIQI